MKTLISTFLLTIACISQAYEADVPGYRYISEIPEITIGDKAASKILCSISTNPLARIQKITIDMQQGSSIASSLILGNSEMKTLCSRSFNNVICNGEYYNLIIEDILSSSTGKNILADFDNYTLFGVSKRNVLCNLK